MDTLGILTGHQFLLKGEEVRKLQNLDQFKLSEPNNVIISYSSLKVRRGNIKGLFEKINQGPL